MKSVFKSFHIRHMRICHRATSDCIATILTYLPPIYVQARIILREILLTVVLYRWSCVVHLPSLVLHFQKYHTSSTSTLKVKVQTIAHAQHALKHVGGADLLGSVCMHLLTVAVSQNLWFSPEFSQCMTE